jgi:hypothetical protein
VVVPGAIVHDAKQAQLPTGIDALRLHQHTAGVLVAVEEHGGIRRAEGGRERPRDRGPGNRPRGLHGRCALRPARSRLGTANTITVRLGLAGPHRTWRTDGRIDCRRGGKCGLSGRRLRGRLTALAERNDTRAHRTHHQGRHHRETTPAARPRRCVRGGCSRRGRGRFPGRRELALALVLDDRGHLFNVQPRRFRVLRGRARGPMGVAPLAKIAPLDFPEDGHRQRCGVGDLRERHARGSAGTADIRDVDRGAEGDALAPCLPPQGANDLPRLALEETLHDPEELLRRGERRKFTTAHRARNGQMQRARRPLRQHLIQQPRVGGHLTVAGHRRAPLDDDRAGVGEAHTGQRRNAAARFVLHRAPDLDQHGGGFGSRERPAGDDS